MSTPCASVTVPVTQSGMYTDGLDGWVGCIHIVNDFRYLLLCSGRAVSRLAEESRSIQIPEGSGVHTRM